MEVVEQSACQFVTEISDPSLAGEARRASVNCAEQIKLSESESGAVAIAVTELATNLVKHAGGGKIISETIAGDGAKGVRVVAIDKGPGIRNIAGALEDGYSTAGSSGTGLGAVRRLASHFEIYSLPQTGTCIVAEFWARKKMPVTKDALRVGAVSVPLRGESVCGDGWMVKSNSAIAKVLLVDGLGHGAYAAEAAREAERVVAESKSASPTEILSDCHDALKKTRGAAAALSFVDREQGTLSFAGLGNISAVLAGPEGTRGMASHNGTLGHQMHRIQEFQFPWNSNSVLIMHSDGLSSRWNLEDYPGILNKGPAILAAVLYRDFARERDDVTVLVAKNSEI